MSPAENDSGKRRNVRRNAIILVVVAVAVYAAFIAAGVVRSQAGM